MKFREITTADVPALFSVRTRTRENTLTLEELQRLGITPRSVTDSLGKATKGWLCEDGDRIVAFSMADRGTGELLVIAVLPEYEGKGVGATLMSLAEEWLAAAGCRRAWLTTDLDPALRAYGFYRKRGWTDWKTERGLRWMELTLHRRPAMSHEKAAPETKGVTVKLLATVDLGPEIEGMEGRELRMRMVTIEPGGVFGPLHDHKDRPGTVYILQGTITDHRDGVATDYGPGVGWPEDRNTLHWLENRGTIPAVEISVDIVRSKPA